MQAIGVDLILGCNGLIWVSPSSSGAQAGDAPAIAGQRFNRQQIEATTRVANAVRALAALYLPIYPATIMDAYEVAVEHGVALKDMGEGAFLMLVLQCEAVRRQADMA
ncbi:hypothetical protein FOA52_004613 [Chlamydomonas sp. UWO 241]|nr:hypothetical protein FOA52_004613 [Chlamydomonas sp. UWO 241]